MSTDLTVHDARVLTARIRESVAGVWDLIVEAYTSRAWTSLGYDSWDDYTRTEFDGVRIALPREDRREVIGSLRDAGLSTRAIASAIGVNDKTVRNDLAGAEYSAPVIGADGKQYAPKPAHVTTTTRTTESTKVEHDVDLETGEITSPGSRAPLQDSAPGVEQLSEPGALDQWLDDDDNLRRARFNKLFYADIARATRITANTAEELAELGDDDALSEYESLINNLERHCQRAKALRGSHLEIVR